MRVNVHRIEEMECFVRASSIQYTRTCCSSLYLCRKAHHRTPIGGDTNETWSTGRRTLPSFRKIRQTISRSATKTSARENRKRRSGVDMWRASRCTMTSGEAQLWLALPSPEPFLPSIRLHERLNPHVPRRFNTHTLTWCIAAHKQVLCRTLGKCRVLCTTPNCIHSYQKNMYWI